jgi:uroporphyrinogen-III synthase
LASKGFDGVAVLSLESRRGDDVRRLIASHRGRPTVVPALKETPLGLTDEVRAFSDRLQRGEFAVAIFLTGTGTRMLASAVESVRPAPAFADALNRTTVIARGPKPFAALRQLGVVGVRQVAQPHTWREILKLIDAEVPVRDCAVAVQEYGEPPEQLLKGLRERGAIVSSVRVYDWSLPEDMQLLLDAVAAIVKGHFRVLLVTSAVQIDHLFRAAADLGATESLQRACTSSLFVASIGPTTSEALRRRGIEPKIEASRPNIGTLVDEAANWD